MLQCLPCIALVALITAPDQIQSQELPANVRARMDFSGDIGVLEGGKLQLVSVASRTWLIPPGTKIEDLRVGATGNLVVEVRSGVLTMDIDGAKQRRHLGDFVVVPADMKVSATTADRSAIIHTLLLP